MNYKMSNMIFIDLDGTIIDVWRRYFSILADFFDLTTDMFDAYRSLKKAIPDDRKLLSKLLNADSARINKYLEFKRNNLETKNYLDMDTLLINADILKKHFDLYQFSVLTIRRNRDALVDQYQTLGIEFLTQSTIVVNPGGIDSKRNWLTENVSKIDQLIVIGDSEIDMATGGLSLCKTIFVNTGLRPFESIRKTYTPDFVYPDINECFKRIPEILLHV